MSEKRYCHRFLRLPRKYRDAQGIMPDSHPEIIEKLRLFLKRGEVTVKYDGVLIDTGLSPVTIYLPEQVKQAFLQIAASKNMSLQELLEVKLMET